MIKSNENGYFMNDEVDGLIDTLNFPMVFYPIVTIFMEDCDYNITGLSFINDRLEIESRDKTGNNSELYLRTNYSDADEKRCLVVARVQFKNKREGNMTKLYNYLLKVKELYGYDRIRIESVQSESMENWCNKYGFIEELNNVGSAVEKLGGIYTKQWYKD